jgi:outer membrane protein assembly factor BamB
VSLVEKIGLILQRMNTKRKTNIKTLGLISLLLLLLAACTPVSTSWPGVAAEGERVFVAHGAQVVAVNIPEQRELWRYAGENGGVSFSAAPSVTEEAIVLGDLGTQQSMFSTGTTTAVYKLRNNGNEPPTTEWVNADRDTGISGRVFGEPLQANNLVYVATSDNHLVALDETTGQKVWDFMAQNANWGQPAYDESADLVFATSTDRFVYALKANTGELVWQKELGSSNAASPILADGLLYIASFDGNLYALEPGDGTVRWTFATQDKTPIWATPTVLDGVIYLVDLGGRAYAVDAGTGTAVWTTPVQLPGSVQADLVHDGTHLYIGSANEDNSIGWLSALALAESGRLVWQQTLPGAVHTSPVLVGDSVVTAVVANGTLQILQYSATLGTPLWSYTPN